MSVDHHVNRPVSCFSVQAVSDPAVMSRVLELFAKRGLVPSRWVSDLAGPGEDRLTIDIQVEGMEQPLAEYIARCMGQIAYVESVLLAEKGRM
jgi:acetolactate synthase small subunit